jgi:hypothetical protein
MLAIEQVPEYYYSFIAVKESFFSSRVTAVKLKTIAMEELYA